MLAAGGRGTRADSATPKQFTPLGGRALILWSLDVLLEVCDPVVVVVPGSHVEFARRAIGEDRVVKLVEGGDTRQESVRIGLAAVEADVVVVHDAARPFVTPSLVQAGLARVPASDAAVPVVEIADTIKRVNRQTIVETIDRADLFAAQTPQVFSGDMLRTAHEAARSEGLVATDDAQLVERYGGRVVTVEGSPTNIKITHPEDFTLAEALLSR